MATIDDQATFFGPVRLLPDDYARPDGPLVVSYGGGVNSIGMVIGMVEHGERPEAVVFSDTGDEKPETYAYLSDVLEPWLSSEGFPPLIRVRRPEFGRGKTGDQSLRDECLRLGTLPSRAYGFGTCADKWKIDPFKYWAQGWPRAQEAWTAGQVVVRAIGYDADESHRVESHADVGYGKAYPLLEWRWDRADCEEACRRHGVAIPPKSACYYCPSSTKTEILWLADAHPALFADAVALEDRAMATGRWKGVKGLGRRFSWRELAAASEEQRARMPEAPVETCTKCVVGW